MSIINGIYGHDPWTSAHAHGAWADCVSWIPVISNNHSIFIYMLPKFVMRSRCVSFEHKLSLFFVIYSPSLEQSHLHNEWQSIVLDNGLAKAMSTWRQKQKCFMSSPEMHLNPVNPLQNILQAYLVCDAVSYLVWLVWFHAEILGLSKTGEGGIWWTDLQLLGERTLADRNPPVGFTDEI